MVACRVQLHRFPAEPVHRRVGRGYVVPGGGFFPGVTTVLKATKPRADREAIARWADRVGTDEAEAILADASQRGTSLHAQVEAFLLRGEEGAGPWWGSIAPFLRRVKAALVEGLVWHPAGFAGAVDCVGVVGGELAILDWKTARRPKRQEWIRDYELQVAAYCAAVNRVYGTRIGRGYVVVALHDRPAQVFELDAVRIFGAWHDFRRRLAAFKELHGR